MAISDLEKSYVLIPPTREEQHESLKPEYQPGDCKSSAHNWSAKATGGALRTSGRNFVDKWGRVCLLRGVNISGASKTPANHDPATFPSAHRTVTFVGRPFPLDKAPEHFARLRRWGLTFIRFMVTWEAIEHAGPGLYDTDYLSYIRSLLAMLPEYGLTAFVSMHQDVWSRYSGGSGAPAWTLELAGFDLDALEETGAAYLGGIKEPGVVQERGLWPTGYQKLACSTMNTLFWAGRTFAPKLLVDRKGEKVNIQDFLQDALLNSYDWLVTGLAGLDSVTGFEMMNEPHRGYISLYSMHKYNYDTDLHLGDTPSALQTFTLGAGYPTKVPHWVMSFPVTKLSTHKLRNVNGRKVWRKDGPSGGECVWRMHGVWQWDEKKKEPVVVKENYFDRMPLNDRKVDWHTDFYYPFVNKWAARVQRSAGQDKIIFVEGIPNELCPSSWTVQHQPENMVYAPHWYDLKTLFRKEFGRLSVNISAIHAGNPIWRCLYWGQNGARENYLWQLRNIATKAYAALGERPVVVGETGICMDLHDGEAFKSGNFEWHERMMDALISGLERTLIGFTLWNYCPNNTDSHGDFWNGENFSWFSEQSLSPLSPLSLDQSNAALDEGGRLLGVILRPYAAKVAGIPLRCEYEANTGCWEFDWANRTNDEPVHKSSLGPDINKPPTSLSVPLKSRETEIFVPTLITKGRRMLVDYTCSAGKSTSLDWAYDASRQTLFVVTKDSTPGATHQIRLTFDPPLGKRFPLDESLLWDFAWLWGSILALLFGILYVVVF
ncbi:hypothetical protein FRB94_011058 [Tulasnella sp. JGI-2019a]|nr:hypothetical protein FRB94_011058 [Tulasnella sp. JGI-2019a]KAG9003134.1 hypothetical protein FRB93_011214 [Tulasnella sp. JGI-2019a]KAG9034002.1 hypothetical protein FRB95_013975 [Tulasnella sp. JGI-2019a]